MSRPGIQFVGNDLIVGDRRLEFQWAVDTAWRAGDRIIVLFDPDAGQSKVGQFANLVAVDERGAVLWSAQLPTSTTGDRYNRVRSTAPIVVSSVSSYDCEIDAATGRIIERAFTK